MTDDRTKQWYIVHTYSGFENKVKESLEQRVTARTQELSGTPSCISERNTSTGNRLPTSRPVTSVDVTITVRMPASVRWSARSAGAFLGAVIV